MVIACSVHDEGARSQGSLLVSNEASGQHFKTLGKAQRTGRQLGCFASWQPLDKQN